MNIDVKLFRFATCEKELSGVEHLIILAINYFDGLVLTKVSAIIGDWAH